VRGILLLALSVRWAAACGIIRVDRLFFVFIALELSLHNALLFLSRTDTQLRETH
jgi:hypothetical protein